MNDAIGLYEQYPPVLSQLDCLLVRHFDHERIACFGTPGAPKDVDDMAADRLGQLAGDLLYFVDRVG